MATESLIRESWIGACLFFRDLDHYFRGRKYGTIQADVVLERELSTLHQDSAAAGRESEPLGLARISETSTLTTSDIILHQRHIHYNKAWLPNSAIPYETMGGGWQFHSGKQRNLKVFRDFVDNLRLIKIWTKSLCPLFKHPGYENLNQFSEEKEKYEVWMFISSKDKKW